MTSASYDSAEQTIKTIQGLLKSGQFLTALEQSKTALAVKPHDCDLLYVASVAARYAGETEQAFDYVTQLIESKPDYGRAYQELGHLYKSLQDSAKACQNYQAAVRGNPALMASWTNILELSDSNEVRRTAAKNIHYLKSLPPILVTVMSQIHEKKLAQAETYCRDFLKQNPAHFEAMRLLALIAEKNHVLDDAEYLLETILLDKPDHLWARFDYINVLHRRQKFEQALEQARKLTQSLPDDYSSRFALANQLAAAGEYDQALEQYELLQQQEPDDPILALLLGHTLKTSGRVAEAIEQYQKAYQQLPTLGDAYWSLANLKTYQFSDDTLAIMQQVLTQPISVEDKIHIHFALGKAYEDRQAYESSFMHYSKGNELKKHNRHFSIEIILDQMQAQQTIFKPGQLPETSGLSAPDPIFVVGMPRAGSTLVEQILSSHSDVDGTMELPHIISYVQEINGRQGRENSANYPQRLLDLTRDELQEYGNRYLDETRMYRQGQPFFIDKMPNNFRHIGFIKQILPQAKIIDARRDPISCCFSVYKQYFAEGQEFSYDINDLARYYKSYVGLMEHWQQCFPGQIYRVQYEQMVTDPEAQIKALLDFLELPMQTACLNFYTNKRPVRTASSEQVRQPIYTKSLKPWMPYEQWLGDLINHFKTKRS